MAETRRGADPLGTRYMRTDLLNGIEVMVLVRDDEALVEQPQLDDLVGLAARMALMELRASRLPRGEN